jgi:hypothetical protein
MAVATPSAEMIVLAESQARELIEAWTAAYHPTLIPEHRQVLERTIAALVAHRWQAESEAERTAALLTWLQGELQRMAQEPCPNGHHLVKANELPQGDIAGYLLNCTQSPCVARKLLVKSMRS